MVINLFKFILLRDLPQLCCDLFAKFASFLRQLLLHLKQIPVRPYASEHVVEKWVELISKAISDPDDMVSKGYFVLRQILPNLVLDNGLSILDVFKRFLNFFLKRSFEIQFVDWVERYYWMEQMIGVQAFRTNLFLAFQTEQNVVLIM